MDVIIAVLVWISYIMGFGTILGIAWCLYVYSVDLKSHSEQTEEEELKLIASLKEGRGIRMSESGENCD